MEDIACEGVAAFAESELQQRAVSAGFVISEVQCIDEVQCVDGLVNAADLSEDPC